MVEDPFALALPLARPLLGLLMGFFAAAFIATAAQHKRLHIDMVAAAILVGAVGVVLRCVEAVVCVHVDDPAGVAVLWDGLGILLALVPVVAISLYLVTPATAQAAREQTSVSPPVGPPL